MQRRRWPTRGRGAGAISWGFITTPPIMGKSASTVRFAAVGDLHANKDSAGTLRGFFAQASEAADALLLCGDLTDYGTAEEAQILADELGAVSVPVVAVLGNHDYESGLAETVSDILKRAGVRLLDGEAGQTGRRVDDILHGCSHLATGLEADLVGACGKFGDGIADILTTVAGASLWRWRRSGRFLARLWRNVVRACRFGHLVLGESAWRRDYVRL